MKLLKRLLLFAVLLPGVLSAAEVSVERAGETAAAFFGQGSTRTAESLSLRWSKKTETGAPAFYLFGRQGGGFVIIAGDDVVEPVLGYSFDGEFILDNMPDNIRWWFDQLSGGIDYLRRTNAVATDRTIAMWRNPAPVSTRADFAPIEMETAKWSQEAPYNDKCPVVNGRRAVTGCVATAAAIIMRYHKWPERGTGVLSDYKYGNITINGYALGHKYEWDKMPLDKVASASPEEKEAIAQLMVDCGVMSYMQYSPSASGAFVDDCHNGLLDHMDYDRSSCYTLKYGYSADRWKEMIRTSLNAKLPVLYEGVGKSGGHAFVLDGYDAQGRFHINWGWGGSNNGYFAFPDFDEFTDDHGAIFGLKKNEGGQSTDIIGMMEGRGLWFANPSAAISAGTPFRVSFGAIYNIGSTNFAGEIGIALSDRNDEIQQTWKAVEVDNDDPLPALYGWSQLSVDCTLAKKPALGEKLIAYYRSARDGIIRPVVYDTDTDIVGFLPIAAEYQPLAASTSLEYKTASRIISVTTLADVDWQLLLNGKAVKEGTTAGFGAFTIETADLQAGTYTLVLTNTVESKEVKFKIGK